jgi:hypothetical protein
MLKHSSFSEPEPQIAIKGGLMQQQEPVMLTDLSSSDRGRPHEVWSPFYLF